MDFKIFKSSSNSFLRLKTPHKTKFLYYSYQLRSQQKTCFFVSSHKPLNCTTVWGCSKPTSQMKKGWERNTWEIKMCMCQTKKEWGIKCLSSLHIAWLLVWLVPSEPRLHLAMLVQASEGRTPLMSPSSFQHWQMPMARVKERQREKRVFLIT